ncbi:MAG: DUF357 domain-containing protein [Thermoplasmata archaeon]|nr:DUF357 domain-containing protein [Thermoplasmata archaeon]
MREITDELLDHYFEITRKALEKIKIASPKSSHLYLIAKDFLKMARAYFSDAEHFRKNGDYPRSLGALCYAHAWLDAGARLGLFDVGDDHDLFTLAK